VNVIGCLVIGVLAALVENAGALTAPMRMLLFTGVLGGFTTFSAFGYETFTLARTQGVMIAGTNVLAQVMLGLLAVWLGFTAARLAIG
jgi:CrcB protein